MGVRNYQTWRSDSIRILKGIPQGGLISPTLFLIAINFIYNEICKLSFSNEYGYQISNEYDALCLSGFADDQAVHCKQQTAEISAVRIIHLIQDLFSRIGLSINPNKSQAIRFNNGVLNIEPLVLNDGITIRSVQND